jgi:hypothetical protein
MSGNRYFGHGPEDAPDTPSLQRLHLMHGLGHQSFFDQSPIQRAPKLACPRVSGVLQRQRFSGVVEQCVWNLQSKQEIQKNGRK